MRESVKFHKMARHLVENCDLFSWCSSFISTFITNPIGDEDLRLLVVLEVCLQHYYINAIRHHGQACTLFKNIMDLYKKLWIHIAIENLYNMMMNAILNFLCHIVVSGHN